MLKPVKDYAMKVDYFTAWQIKCGIADYSQNLYNYLKNRTQLNVIPINPRNNPFYYLSLGRKSNGARLAHIQYEYGIFNTIKPLRNYYALMMKQINGPRLVTLHSLPYPLSSLPADKVGARAIKIKARNFLYQPFMHNWLRHFYELADYYIVHTKSHYSQVAEFVKAEKVFHLPHGIPEPTSRLDSVRCKKELGLDNKKVLAIFGFIKPHKGYELVLEILNDLPPQAFLLIAGGPQTNSDAGYLESLKSLIEKKGLAKRIKITGYLSPEQIPVVMGASDIVLAPFRTMNASGSLCLSLAYHKPIIASDLEPAREINSEINCLQLFEKENPADLYEKINFLISHKESRVHLAEKAAEFAQEYSFANMALRLVDIYKKILNGA